MKRLFHLVALATLFLTLAAAPPAGSFQGTTPDAPASPSVINCDVAGTNATSVDSVTILGTPPVALVAGTDYTVAGLPDDKFEIKLTAVGKTKVSAGDKLEIMGSTAGSSTYSVALSWN